MIDELKDFLVELDEGTRSKMDVYPSRELAFTAYVLEEIAEKININEYHVEDLILRTSSGAIIGEITAYAFSENGETLSLFYTDYDSSSDGNVRQQSSGNYQLAISRMQGFYLSAMKGAHIGMEVSSPLYSSLKDIYDSHNRITSVYLRVISNYMIANSEIKRRRIDDKQLYPDAWDLKKIYANLHSGLDHVAINIEFDDEDYKDYEIPFIEMESGDYGYKCVLALFPGKLLYTLYEQYNVSLLLNNVRYFLGFKGSNRSNANIGMLSTLKNEHEMFLAYNNGITAVAANVIGKDTNKKHLNLGKSSQVEDIEYNKRYITTGILQSIKDFRIVNGGQTTAALFMSKFTDREHKINLDGVFVQVKIIILPSTANDKIANITKYSNSQTKIKYQDFTISNPYNQTMEKLSRTMNINDGNNNSYYWFYERVKGQYDAEKNKRKSKADQAYFASLYPKDKKFKKELIAKVWNCWSQSPDLACKGEGACYDKFITKIVTQGYVPDEKHYRETIALLIIYQKLDAYARERKFAAGKNGIIAYVIAYLNYVTFNRLNLRKIWDNQKLSTGLEKYLEQLSEWMFKAFSLLSGTEGMVKFCKQANAFDRIKKFGINVPISLIDDDLIH